MLAIAGGVTWLIADLMSDYVYLHVLIPYWNALMLSGLFLIVVCLLTAFQGVKAHLEETVRLRTRGIEDVAGGNQGTATAGSCQSSGGTALHGGQDGRPGGP